MIINSDFEFDLRNMPWWWCDGSVPAMSVSKAGPPWVRFWTPPLRVRCGRHTPRNLLLATRSKERYLKRPDLISDWGLFQQTMLTGEIGSVSGITFLTEPKDPTL